jgi:hypothetical protein
MHFSIIFHLWLSTRFAFLDLKFRMHFLHLYLRYMSLFYTLLNLIIQIIFVKKSTIMNNYESPRQAVLFTLMSIQHSSFQIFYPLSFIKNEDRTVHLKISACLTTISNCRKTITKLYLHSSVCNSTNANIQGCIHIWRFFQNFQYNFIER